MRQLKDEMLRNPYCTKNWYARGAPGVEQLVIARPLSAFAPWKSHVSLELCSIKYAIDQQEGMC